MATDCGGVGAVANAQVALSTGSLHNWALDRVFEVAAGAGFDGVELLVDARTDSANVGYLRRLCERWGTRILSVHAPFVPRVEGWSEAPEERVERAVALAEAVGAETVVAHLPLRWEVGRVHLALGGWRFERLVVAPWRSAAGARYARWLVEELPELQARARVRVAVENMPAHRLLGRAMRLHRLNSIEGLGRFPYVVLDTTHWGTWGIDPLEAYRALRGRVVHVHLSDYDGREHRLPGKGHLRLRELLSEMGRDGFSGTVAIEVEPSALGEAARREERAWAELRTAASEARAALATPSHSHNPIPNQRTPLLASREA